MKNKVLIGDFKYSMTPEGVKCTVKHIDGLIDQSILDKIDKSLQILNLSTWKGIVEYESDCNTPDISIDDPNYGYILWGVNDFLNNEFDGWTITRKQAQVALKAMIFNADCDKGIDWNTFEVYYKKYGTKYADFTKED